MAAVREQWNGNCGVYCQGNSRVVTVPADVECEIGDGVQTLIGKKNGQPVYVLLVMSSLDNQEEITARRAAIKQSDAETDDRYDCGTIRANSPSKIATIPSQCDDELFGNKTSLALFVGMVNGSLAYLKFVPENYMQVKFDGADL